MSTSLTNKPIESLDLVPPNLRFEPLYLIFSDILDKGVENFYTEQTYSVENIYNPDNPYYDPKYILSILGGSEIAELLSEDIDSKAISMIYPGLLKQRGKIEIVETLLKIIKIDYSHFNLIRTREGCSWLNVVLKDGSKLTFNEIAKMEKLIRKFLPICVRFRSISSCEDFRDRLLLSEKIIDLDLGCHTLDDNMILDRSRIDNVQGHSIPNTGVVVKLCHKASNYVEISYDLVTDSARTQAFNNFVDCSSSRVFKVDDNFELDKDNALNIRYALQERKEG